MSEEPALSAMEKSDKQVPGDKVEEDEEDLFGMESYFDPEIGDVISSRFRILKKLGQGQFSNVWLCRNVLDSKYIAMKVVRCKTYYNECAHHEISMLKKIHSGDSSDQRRERLAKLLEHFVIPAKYEGVHVCMVFPTIGNDLFTFIRERYSRGVPTVKVKRIIRQILEGIDYLHTKCGVIHTDLKPENIIICFEDDDVGNLVDYANMLETTGSKGDEGKINDSASTSFAMTQETGSEKASGSHSVSGAVKASVPAKKKSTFKPKSEPPSPVDFAFTLNLYSNSEVNIIIADFGNSCPISDHLSTQIQTRNYRSPEVVIEANYGTPVDIWSIGCIAFELATGKVLFNPQPIENLSKNEIHLALMIQIFGNVPKAVRDTGLLSSNYFTESGDLINVDTSERRTMFETLVKVYKWAPGHAYPFSEFLSIMLQYDPNKRATAAQCLQHKWLKN